MFKLISLKAQGFKKLDLSEPIRFPRGTLLIHGRNESGKSTVMEAIHYALFGMALKPSKRASNEDLVNYTLSEGYVQLDFTIDDDRYRVTRILKRRAPNIHELRITRKTGRIERVQGARAVNNTIMEELHGIDSDTLLNSCLVEQKELGKLESAQLSERVRAISTLLNLEAFIDAEREVKGEQSILEKENNLKKIDFKDLEEKKREFEEAAENLRDAEERLKEIEKELPKLRRERDELTETIQTIRKVKEIDARLSTLHERQEGLEKELTNAEKQLEEIEKAQGRIEDLEKNQIPGAREILEKAKQMVETLEKLLKLESQIENLAKDISILKEKLGEAEKRVEEAEENQRLSQELEEKVREYAGCRRIEEEGERLEGYLRKLENLNREYEDTIREIETVEKRLEGCREAEANISSKREEIHTLEQERKRAGLKKIVGVAATVIGVLGLAGYLIHSYFAILGAIALFSGAIILATSRTGRIDSELNRSRRELEDLLIETANIHALKERRTALEEKRDRIKAQEGETDSQFLSLLEELPKSPRDYPETIQKAYREDLDAATTLLRMILQEDLLTLQRLEDDKGRAETVAGEMGERLREKEDLEKALNIKEEEVQERRGELKGLEEESGVTSSQEKTVREEALKAERTLSRMEGEISSLKEKISGREEYEKIRDETGKGLEKAEGEIREELEKRSMLLEKIEVGLEEEESIASQLSSITREIGKLEQEEEEKTGVKERSSGILEEYAEIPQGYEVLKVGIERADFELEAMERARKLLNTTRDAIVGSVKGSIEKNMTRFLPTLTANRYSLARLDEKEYRIEVYDKEARGWREKGVFSGATQDQFSLALRLAFAVSTLPSTRGARPGFIFLDEPLIGFDTERRAGLMKLLKEELHRYFEQIIIISHLAQLRNEISNEIFMEEGKAILQSIANP